MVVWGWWWGGRSSEPSASALSSASSLDPPRLHRSCKSARTIKWLASFVHDLAIASCCWSPNQHVKIASFFELLSYLFYL